MSEIDNIIQITITRETTAVSTASFNIPAILATFTNFSERARIYTDLSSVGADFSSTSNVYKMASKLFGQDFGRPPSIVVGRRQVDSVVGTIQTVVTGQTYSVTVNGTTYSYVAAGGNTTTQVVAGIKTQYDLAPKAGITFVNNSDGTFDVAVSVLGTAWSLSSSSNIVLENDTPTETWVEAKEAVQAVNNTWYALNAETHVQSEVLALAAAIQGEHKIYITSSQDVNLTASTLTDVAALLKAAGYTRTSVVYSPEANTNFPESVWTGSVIPQVVGSTSWNFRQGAGAVTLPSSLVLSDTARVNLRSKNANMFTTVGGVNIFQDGIMVDGRPMTEIMISDWIYARMQEQVYSRLVNLPKIPYTKSGFAIIQGEMLSVGQQGIANNAIASFSVSVPDPALIPINTRAQGIATLFKFTAQLTNEVRKVEIRGTLAI